LLTLAAVLGERLKAKGLMLATAESCTGGWVAQAVTAIAGSSDWFERGFITYSNEAKREMLGVGSGTLERFGAVSEETAREMALGAVAASRTDVAAAVTGVAGPAGGTPAKPVGMVCFGWAFKDGRADTMTRNFAGDREAVRRQSVVVALEGLIERLGE
jgi:nicotinamide-nucleotide amidase